MVPVASAFAMVTVFDASLHSRALLILTFTVSPLSLTESSMMRTKAVVCVAPGRIQSLTFGRLP